MIERHLLEETAAGLGVESSRLHAAPSIARDRSTVTPITVDGAIAAWHKHIRAGGDAPGERGTGTARELLSRAQACTDAAITAFSTEPNLTIAPVLAVDVAHLSIVTGHVEGTPLGVPLPRPTRGPSMCAAQLRRTGRSLAIIESATPVLSGPDPAYTRARILHPFETLATDDHLRPSQLKVVDLEKRVEEAVAAIERAGYPTVTAHGDASPTNVLVTGRSVGLIDSEWIERMAGFDLATLSVRLEVASARLPLLGRWMTSRLIEGYQTVSPLGPGFHFERAQRYLRLLATGLLRSRHTLRVAAIYLSADYPTV